MAVNISLKKDKGYLEEVFQDAIAKVVMKKLSQLLVYSDRRVVIT